MNCLESNLESNEITLIRVTTHDHFHQKTDIQKHFKVKNRFLEYELESEPLLEHMQQTTGDAFDTNEDSTTTTSFHIHSTTQELRELVLVNINEIVSASEFETLLNAFLLSTTDKTLMVQCTNNDNNEFLHNLHIQYLIEKAKHVARQNLNENKKT
eukprot:317244_1